MTPELYEALCASSENSKMLIKQALEETGYIKYVEEERVKFVSGNLPYGKIYHPPLIKVTVDE